ncbi:MAG: hypothetical protein K2X66_12690, partial [Cyanobacteria bacterium]|nr:hypothetical protein [Cyanobacteriota bacterium]
WASRKGRIKKIKATCERVFCIFPFEESLYQAENIPVTYVGHPLTGKLPPKASKEDFCNRHGLNPHFKLLALFPGSRKSEMGFHLDIILNALPLIQKGLGKSSPCQFVMAIPSSLSETWLQKFLYPKLNLMTAQYPTLKIIGVKQENHALLSIADAAVIKSGTSTLEAALYQTPMVIVYKVHRLFFELALRLCYLPCLGLPNILTSVQNPPFPELLQTQFTSENIAQQVLPLFNPQSESYQKQHAAFNTIQSQFGGENATQRVAEELAKLMML